MPTTGRTFFSALVASLVAVTSLVGLAMAHDGHDRGRAQHGGVEAKTKKYHFEAVFTAHGVKLYAHEADHKAVDARGLAATATFFHPNAPDQPWFSRELKATTSSPGRPAGSLDLALDLSKV